MLSTGYHALALYPLDIHTGMHTRQKWISARPLPVPSRGRIPCQVHHRPKRDIDTLAPELGSQSGTLGQHEALVPGHAAVHARGEDGGVVGVTHTDGGVFEAETVELEAGNGAGIANAAAARIDTGGEVDFFIDREASDKGFGLCDGAGPATIAVDRLYERC